MSRKDKQADLRRRMAEARSKLLQSQHHVDEEEEGNTEVGGNSVVRTKKRPLSPSSGTGGILRKSKYTTETNSATTQSKSSNPNSATALGALMTGYGESSSEEEEDNHLLEASATNATFRTAPQPPKTTKDKEDDSKSHQELNNTSFASKPVSIAEDAPVSEDAWDEFNALLEADEAANNAVPASSSNDNDEKITLVETKDDGKDSSLDNNKPLGSNESESENDVKKNNKEDIYDNDDMNNMEQTSYEARLARLILLKSKRGMTGKEKSPIAANLSADDFYDTNLAWAEEEQGDQQVEEQDSSGVDPNTEDGAKSSSMHTRNLSTTSMVKILRGRRDEARMLASRGEDVASNNSGDFEASDGNWF